MTPRLCLIIIITMSAWIILVALVMVAPKYVPRVTSEKLCPDGRLCPDDWQCCEMGCCAPTTLPPRHILDEAMMPWYTSWSALIIVALAFSVLVCCVWCLMYRRCFFGVYSCTLACCIRRPLSDRDSAGSLYPPPRYSRCGSIHQAPPPYSEVTTKPDLYPLVITCGEGHDKSSGNYLMVHYFRNYVIRAPGSLSATSTVESLNSSCLCNAANEANTIVPPPYSCAGNYPERNVGCGSILRSLSTLTDRPARDRSAPYRDIITPGQPLDTYDLELDLIDCDMFEYFEGGQKPRVGTSPPAHRRTSPSDENPDYDKEYCLHNLFSCQSPEPISHSCESPPRPTSPTQSRDVTRPSEDRRFSAKKIQKSRKSSLYMPLSTAYPVRPTRVSPGSRVSSRSAPATPCGGLVPNVLNFTQRVSASRIGSRSSRLEEENDPLLADSLRGDHKF